MKPLQMFALFGASLTLTGCCPDIAYYSLPTIVFEPGFGEAGVYEVYLGDTMVLMGELDTRLDEVWTPVEGEPHAPVTARIDDSGAFPRFAGLSGDGLEVLAPEIEVFRDGERVGIGFAQWECEAHEKKPLQCNAFVGEKCRTTLPIGDR